MTLNFKDPFWTAPDELVANDAFAVKVVAVVGHDGEWAAYMGPSFDSDEMIALEGDKLLPEQAEPLFCVFRESGRHYRV